MSNEKVLKNQLLIESSEFSAKIKLSKALKESVKLSQGKAGTLIVRNVPCTILNRRNQNGRIYPTDVMEKAIKEARFAIETKQLLSKPNEHPDSSFVAPSEASHVIIDAYIKKNVNIVVEGKKERQDVLFMDWEVLNTQNGKDLRALLEAECSIGTSIRGVGDLVGDTVDNYQLLGVDIVGNPSSSTYTRMPVAESVKVEFANEKSLKEGFTVTSSSTDVARDIESAGLLANKLDKADFATISNTSTKLEHDIDPKTGAQTTLVTFEADTSDDVTDLNQALAMAQRILTNPYSHVDSVTIENIDEEDETINGSKKESVEEGSEEYIPESEMEEGIAGSILGGAAGATVGHPILGAAAGSMIQDKFFNNDEKESVMKEAKEEKDPKDGRKYVLKAPNGFVGMDGNALVFKDNPAEALHFISGKEESGLVHLSGVEKILDTMGVYDIEKYYRKPENEISNKNTAGTDELNEVGDINVSTGDVLSGNDVDVPLVGKESCSEKLTEDNGYDTKYVAEVHINKDGAMESTDTVPVSSTELQSALSEVSNLWNMKTQKGEGQVTLFLLDTTTGEKYKYNNESNTLEPATEVKESTLTEDDSVKQNGNQLTVDLGGDHGSVTKDFEDNAQASVVKAGLEQGKIAGNVMLEGDGILDGWYVANEKIGITGPFESKEEAENEFKDFLDDVTIEYLEAEPEEDREHNDIESGWYAGADNIGVAGPFASREEAEEEFKDFLDKVSIEYLSSSDEEDESEEEEDGLNERLYSNPSEPSDDLIDDSLEEEVLDEWSLNPVRAWAGTKDLGGKIGDAWNNWMRSSYTPEAIIKAAQNNKPNFIKLAMNKGVDVGSMKDSKGNTPMTIAIDNGNERVVDVLSYNENAVNTPDGRHKTPLMHAIDKQNPQMINMLLDSGAFLNTNKQDMNILQYAALNKDKTAYRTLINYFEQNDTDPTNTNSYNDDLNVRAQALMNKYKPQTNNVDAVSQTTVQNQEQPATAAQAQADAQPAMNQNRINTYKSASNVKSNNPNINTSNVQSNVSNQSSNTSINNNANLNKIETALESGKQAIKAILPYVNDSSALYLGLAASEGNEEVKELINSELKSRASKLAAKKKA